MSIEEKVSLTISINKEYRDRLRTMAAEKNLLDPDQITSASTIAREIICEYLDKDDHKVRVADRDDFSSGPPSDVEQNHSVELATENKIK
jgi:hypothetical protein